MPLHSPKSSQSLGKMNETNKDASQRSSSPSVSLFNSMFNNSPRPDSASGSNYGRQDDFATFKNGTTDSPSLAAHYIPDKLVSSPTSWGAEARRQSRLAVGGFGAAAGRRQKMSMQSMSNNSLRNLADTRRRSEPLQAGSTNDLQSPGLTSAIELKSGQSTNSIPRPRKWGAGRRAWGPNGGGHAALGAGGYESDEGVEIEPQHADTHSFNDETKFEAKPTRLFANQSDRGSTPALSDGRNNRYSDDMDSSHLSSTRKSLIGRLFGIGIPSLNAGKWNKFKWCLFAANVLLTCYTIAGFIAIMLTWSNYFPSSSVILLVNQIELILGTVAMGLCIITAIIGWTGILLNNRAFLAVYAFMLWVSLAFIVAPGYIAYKKRTFNLPGKANYLWSRQLDLTGRRLVQTVLQCCGYYSPYIEAAADGNRCYARSELPGCKGPIIEFERTVLKYFYVCAFATVPAHLIIVVVTMLCANHITYRFGKGITPQRYRVDDQTIQMAYKKNAIERATITSRSHLLYSDETQLHEPRPPFWHDASANSLMKSK